AAGVPAAEVLAAGVLAAKRASSTNGKCQNSISNAIKVDTDTDHQYRLFMCIKLHSLKKGILTR
ncbi:hypothetical protein V7161_22690, partial [Neobacillus drentensis]|uniref:hypothetical protein n=1 Tax=Neobacillus drentensis TaxID=220684 RepID=UPI003001D548